MTKAEYVAGYAWAVNAIASVPGARERFELADQPERGRIMGQLLRVWRRIKAGDVVDDRLIDWLSRVLTNP